MNAHAVEAAHVAHNILLQLGGAKFLAMTGANCLTSTPNSLRFKLPRGARDGINFVTITLADDDTYGIVWSKFRGLNVTNLRTDEMVYGDQLRELFETVTGLRVSL